MTAATAYYFCTHPDCHEHGTTTAGDRGAAAKHKDATGHGVSITTSGEWAERAAVRK